MSHWVCLFVCLFLIAELWVSPVYAYLSMADLNHVRGKSYHIDPSQNFFSQSDLIDDSDWSPGSRETNSLPLIEAPVVMSNPIWNWIHKAASIYRFYSKKDSY
ncbi:unnamed protein product, partial [Mesorhabditis belari]|uniref:Uncharacterized protein n=1 Tax=Mesorhabditis belari TaxID=2138241 RepID=A0AAF3EAA5_9BILA